MTLSGIYNLVRDWLWEMGRIGAAADLGLDDWSPGGHEPCPSMSVPPRCANLEAASCPVTCLNSLRRPLSR